MMECALTKPKVPGGLSRSNKGLTYPILISWPVPSSTAKCLPRKGCGWFPRIPSILFSFGLTQPNLMKLTAKNRDVQSSKELTVWQCLWLAHPCHSAHKKYYSFIQGPSCHPLECTPLEPECRSCEYTLRHSVCEFRSSSLMDQTYGIPKSSLSKAIF